MISCNKLPIVLIHALLRSRQYNFFSDRSTSDTTVKDIDAGESAPNQSSDGVLEKQLYETDDDNIKRDISRRTTKKKTSNKCFSFKPVMLNP